MNSTRKLLLTEDNDKNGTFKRNFNVDNKMIILEDNEEYEYEDGGY